MEHGCTVGWQGLCACVSVHVRVCVHVCVSREEPLPVAGFSFCVCFLHAYIYMYVYACTQDVSSSAHVDTGPRSNLCVFSQFLALQDQNVPSSISSFTQKRSVQVLPGACALSSEPEDSFSPGPLNGHTASRMRPTLHVDVSQWGRFTVPGKAKWVEGPRQGGGLLPTEPSRHC